MHFSKQSICKNENNKNIKAVQDSSSFLNIEHKISVRVSTCIILSYLHLNR